MSVLSEEFYTPQSIGNMQQYPPQFLFRESLFLTLTFLYGIRKTSTITKLILYYHVIVFCPRRIIPHHMFVLPQNCVGIDLI
jgi:hypothetical protein